MNDPLKAATAAVGLLAGIVAAVYVLGGLVIALRLFFDGFELGSVAMIVGQLPRELVVTTALLNVGLPAATFGLLATIVAALLGARRRVPGDRRNGPGALIVLGLLTLVLVAPALLQAHSTDGLTPAFATSVPAIFFAFLVACACWREVKRVANRSWPPTVTLFAVGALAAAVAVTPATMFAAALDFEKAQVCYSPGQPPQKGLLIGEGDDRVLLETNFSREESVVSVPTDDVTKSEYGDILSTFTCPAPAAATAAEVVEADLGGHGSSSERRLAASLRPRLRFDTGERWRPLEVGSFLGERFAAGRGHGACPVGAEPPCPMIESLDALRRHPTAPAYLDIHGERRNGGDFHSPDPACHGPPPVVDCNGGPGSAIYYRRTTHEGRWYWDYWWFLRYNDYTGSFNRCAVVCGDHEGDWEGITVITTASAEPEIVAAIYAAHKDRVLVDRAVMPLSGSHPLAFVARGTHAAYPFACDRRCKQYASRAGFRLPEDPHDGGVAWGGNSDAECLAVDCVRPLPEVGRPGATALPLAGAWAGWPGKWGESCHNGCTGRRKLHEASPRSPGSQARFECPWVATRVALPDAEGGGLTKSEEADDDERLFAACAARRGGR